MLLPRSASASTSFPIPFPESVYENIPHSGVASSSFSKKDDLGSNDFKVFDSFTDPSGVTYVYGAHMANGARIANHQASAQEEWRARYPVDSNLNTLSSMSEQPDGKIYAYKFQLRNNPVTKWVEVWCDATTGKVIQTIDFGNKVSYKAIQVPRRDANEGFSMVSNPELRGSSPNGWTAGRATGGNNVITLTPSGRTTPATRNGVFDTQFNSRRAPGTDANIAAAAVNLFYISNMMHDITYQYGFTERAGNFQTNNFGKGGRGNDAVVINVLNPSDVNNADFLTPPDGRPGVMNMYRFNYPPPSQCWL
ncbi:hypothetical protein BSLG_010757 [Batrachochytrium salamandrivorans]|nr:hypothetical protein BSLG_010757 [Batrachochytrium salamandrivorans]